MGKAKKRTGEPCYQHDSYDPNCSDCYHDDEVAPRQPQGEATPRFGRFTVLARCEKCHKDWQYDNRERFGIDRPLCVECEAQTKGGEKLDIMANYDQNGKDQPKCQSCGRSTVHTITASSFDGCVTCGQSFKPSSPPATAGTARELADKAFTISYHSTSYYCGYKVSIPNYAGGEVVTLADAETYADHRVRPLQTSLAKLYAAIGPMDELDTVDDAVARVEKLRQERDAAVKGFNELAEARRHEREARARAEKALREATDAIRWALGSNGDFTERKAGQGPYWWRTELRERSERALASLKSSEG